MPAKRNPWDDTFWMARPQWDRREKMRRWDDDLSRLPAFFVGVFVGFVFAIIVNVVIGWVS